MTKKTRTFPALLLAAIASGCGNSPQNENYTIDGTVKGVPSGMVRLSAFDNDTRTFTAIDSTQLTDGVFKLEGKMDVPVLATLTIDNGNWSFPVFVENSRITISADTTGSEHFDWTQYGGSKGAQIKNYKVNGSKSHDEWMAYENDPGLKIHAPAMEELNKTYANAKDAAEKELIREKFDSIGKLTMALQRKWIDSFVMANPSSAAGPYLFQNLYIYNRSMPVSELESMMGKFSGTAQSTMYYKSLSKTLTERKQLQPGNVAPDFTLMTRDSTKFTLSSLRGQYVMLDFWASWCVPCRKAFPHWREIYGKYHPKGFEIVGITNDSRWSDWFKALDVEKLPWPQVADEFPLKNMPARVISLYKAPYLPSYVLLDKEGKIILHNATEEEISQKLEQLLGS